MTSNLKEPTFSFRQLIEKNAINFGFLLLIIVACIALPKFRSINNALIVTRGFSMVTIVAMGQAMVLISGGFDLSVGAIATCAALVCAYAMNTLGLPIGVAILLGILVGVACGLFNGWLVAILRVNPLIATLGSMMVFNGIVLILSRGYPITFLPQSFKYLGQGYFLKVPVPIWLMIIVAIVLSIVLSKTVYGRKVYAVGGSEKTSLFVGINVAYIKITTYMICGALAGFAGIILSSRLDTAQAGMSASWNLPSIAAAVIGGVALFGGEGKIYRVLIGGALIGVISNILILFHLSSYWQDLVTGIILISAVAAEAIQIKKESI